MQVLTNNYLCEVVVTDRHALSPSAAAEAQPAPALIAQYLVDKVRFVLLEARARRLGGTEPVHEAHTKGETAAIANRVVALLTSRPFNYQSKRRIGAQLGRATDAVARHVRRSERITIYYDLGGGYHASTDADGSTPVTFDITVGEILACYQMTRFASGVRQFYPNGVEFRIVIDNGVANYINDIPLECTARYCAAFRDLIRRLEMDDFVSLLVETERFDWASESKLIRYTPARDLSQAAYSNIVRFLGRPCSLVEAKDRQGRHDAAVELSESLVRAVVGSDIRLLQQSDTGELTFRPFPGGAARIQTGRVGFLIGDGGARLHLVTDQSKARYRCVAVSVDVAEIVEQARDAIEESRFRPQEAADRTD